MNINHVFCSAFCSFLVGCAAPSPLIYGDPVEPPQACKEYRVRGGYCSLQRALDDVHARFKYVSDNVAYADKRQWFNYYNADVWNLLPESGEGDCEDFALTLRWYLNSRGITGTNLLVIKTSTTYHAAIELNGWVMESGSLFPTRSQDLPGDWQIVMAGDESGAWRKVRSRQQAR